MKFILILFTFFLSVLVNSQTDSFHYLNLEESYNFEDLTQLDKEIEQYNFFFSGENHMFSTSNSKLELKLLMYFNKKAAVNNLLLEFGAGTGWLVNKFLTTENKTIEETVKVQFSDEYVNLFKKIKEHNKDTSKNKITVHGVDLQRSYSLGIEALYLQLPLNDSNSIPDDSISREIDLLKFIQGYVRAKADVDLDEYSKSSKSFYGNYYYGYNLTESLDLLIKNFNTFKTQYKDYLGIQYDTYSNIIESIANAKRFKKYDGMRNPYGTIFREDYMFNNMKKLVKTLPNEKFYGQFGRAHIVKNEFTNDLYNTYNFSSLVARINKSKDLNMKNKVLSMGIFYTNTVGNPYAYTYSNESVNEAFKDLKKDGVALEKIDNISGLDSITENSFQYLIVNKGQLKNEAASGGYDAFFMGYQVDFGQHDIDLGTVPNYFNTDFGDTPLRFWGLSYFAYENFGFYMDLNTNFYSSIRKDISDSVSVQLKGWNIFAHLGYDITPGYRFNIIPAIGLGYQKMRTKVTEEKLIGYTGIENMEYTLNNEALMLNGKLDLRFVLFQGFSLSAKGGYLLDLSKKNWRYNKNSISAENKHSGLWWSVGFALEIVE